MKKVAYSKAKQSRIFSSALIGLAVTLVMSTGAKAGPDQIASLEVPGFKTWPEKFDLGALETKISNTNAMANDLFGLVANDYRSQVMRPTASTAILKLSAAPTVVPKPASPLIRVSMFNPTAVKNVAGSTSKLTCPSYLFDLRQKPWNFVSPPDCPY